MGNSQLFGADDESDQQELDDAEKNGENGSSILPSLLFPLFVDPVELNSFRDCRLSSIVDEIQELRKEALAVRELRSTLTEPGAAQRIFEKVRFNPPLTCFRFSPLAPS